MAEFILNTLNRERNAFFEHLIMNSKDNRNIGQLKLINTHQGKTNLLFVLKNLLKRSSDYNSSHDFSFMIMG